jgi:predicted nucleic-acid-binding protein
MRAVDTNILVRLIARDDAKQLAVAEDAVARGAWVSTVVLAEMAWVLEAVYALDHGEIATVVEMLLSHEHLSLQDAEAAAAALERYRQAPAVGFTDCLVLEIARKAGHLPLLTFDRRLSKVDGAARPTPAP